jgi:hypothetical protein
MKAQQTIHLGLYDPANYRQVYDLYLEAFGDACLAQEARSRAMELYVERQTNGKH